MQYTHFSSKQKKILDDIKIIICEKKKRQFKSSTSFESGETPYNILLMVRKEYFCALLAKAVKILYFTCWKTTNSDRLFVSSAECQGDNVKLCQISTKRRRVCLNSR